MWQRALGAGLGWLALACSGETNGAQTKSDVTGAWCGADVSSAERCVGDEVEYLELLQDGTEVTGQICEAYEKDCAPIEDGKLEGTKLTFGFSPTIVGGRGDLQLTGDVLMGTLHSDKCACELPFTFHRL